MNTGNDPPFQHVVLPRQAAAGKPVHTEDTSQGRYCGLALDQNAQLQRQAWRCISQGIVDRLTRSRWTGASHHHHLVLEVCSCQADRNSWAELKRPVFTLFGRGIGLRPRIRCDLPCKLQVLGSLAP